ncbi:MAG TPA: hypothetical protein VF897_04335, partial [Roseiflexaceae bacterium]
MRRGDVGHVGRGGRDIAAGDAIDEAREEQHPQRAADAEQVVAEGRAEHADQQHRAPAVAVGEPAEDRRAHE